jgi:hypothetical protein
LFLSLSLSIKKLFFYQLEKKTIFVTKKQGEYDETQKQQLQQNP